MMKRSLKTRCLTLVFGLGFILGVVGCGPSDPLPAADAEAAKKLPPPDPIPKPEKKSKGANMGPEAAKP